MYSKPNYELKSKLLREVTMLENYKRYSKSVYHYVYGKDMSNDIPYSMALDLSYFHRTHFPEEWKECGRISHAHCNRVVRLKKRIADMVLLSPCLFLTFTFNDYSLSHNTADSRKQAVRRFLNDLNVPYVANIDFGKKNHREHYHAVVAIERIDYKSWKYGAINGQTIRNHTDDIKKLAKYVAKLTNHAIKETVKRNAIIYSRKKHCCVNDKFYVTDADGVLSNYEK